jgi:hypothetical protein
MLNWSVKTKLTLFHELVVPLGTVASQILTGIRTQFDRLLVLEVNCGRDHPDFLIILYFLLPHGNF